MLLRPKTEIFGKYYIWKVIFGKIFYKVIFGKICPMKNSKCDHILFPKAGKLCEHLQQSRSVGFVSFWCPFPHNQNFSNLSCRDSAVVTPNTKTIFFNKLLFITALTDVSRGKMLTSPMKSLDSFSHGDVFLSLFSLWFLLYP